MNECIDPIVGKILAGWRYDISGIAPEMRADYEEHFDACERCRTRQRPLMRPQLLPERVMMPVELASFVGLQPVLPLKPTATSLPAAPPGFAVSVRAGSVAVIVTSA